MIRLHPPIRALILILLIAPELSSAGNSEFQGTWRFLKTDCFEDGELDFRVSYDNHDAKILEIGASEATSTDNYSKKCKRVWKFRITNKGGGVTAFVHDGLVCTPFPCSDDVETVTTYFKKGSKSIPREGVIMGKAKRDRDRLSCGGVILELGRGELSFFKTRNEVLSLDKGTLVVVPASASTDFFCRDYYERK